MADIRLKIAADLAEFQQLIDRFNGSVEELAETLVDEADAREQSTKVYKAEVDAVQATVAAMHREARTAGKGLYQTLDEITNKYGEWRQKMVEGGGGISQTLDAAMPQASTGIVSAVSSFKSTLLAEVPFGGLIGLMLLGGKQDEEVRAVSAQVARSFQQAGDVGRSTLSGITREVQELSRHLGKGPTGMFEEFGRSAQEFARVGVDLGQVLEKNIIGHVRMTKDSILETSVAIDSLFRQGAGTSARQMASIVRDFNADLAEAQRITLGIGFAARDTGQSVEAFTTSVMRSASALRTQRVDISEVAEAQLKLIDVMKTQMPGAQPQFLAGYAQRGIEQISQGIAGLSVGMSAVLGERISNRVQQEPGQSGLKEFGRVDGLDAYYAMKEGFGGLGQNDKASGMFMETIKELGNLAKEQGGTFNEQRYLLEKLVPGLGPEGSRAILSVRDEVEKGSSLQDAIARHQKEFTKAFQDRGAETNRLLRASQDLQQGIADIGASLLAATINGFKILHSIGAMAHAWFTEGKGSDSYKAAADYFDRVVAHNDKVWNRLGVGMDFLSKGLKEGGETLLGQGPTYEQSKRKYQGYEVETEEGKVRLSKSELRDAQAEAMEKQQEARSELLKGMLKQQRFRLNDNDVERLVGMYEEGSMPKEARREAMVKEAQAISQRTGYKLPIAGLIGEAEKVQNVETKIKGKKTKVQLITSIKFLDEEAEPKALEESR